MQCDDEDRAVEYNAFFKPMDSASESSKSGPGHTKSEHQGFASAGIFNEADADMLRKLDEACKYGLMLPDIFRYDVC